MTSYDKDPTLRTLIVLVAVVASYSVDFPSRPSDGFLWRMSS